MNTRLTKIVTGWLIFLLLFTLVQPVLAVTHQSCPMMRSQNAKSTMPMAKVNGSLSTHHKHTATPDKKSCTMDMELSTLQCSNCSDCSHGYNPIPFVCNAVVVVAATVTTDLVISIFDIDLALFLRPPRFS